MSFNHVTCAVPPSTVVSPTMLATWQGHLPRRSSRYTGSGCANDVNRMRTRFFGVASKWRKNRHTTGYTSGLYKRDGGSLGFTMVLP